MLPAYYAAIHYANSIPLSYQHTMISISDAHKILGTSIYSTKEEIKAKYRALSQIWHPDNGGNTEEFKKVNEAYERLCASYPDMNEVLSKLLFQEIVKPEFNPMYFYRFLGECHDETNYEQRCAEEHLERVKAYIVMFEGKILPDHMQRLQQTEALLSKKIQENAQLMADLFVSRLEWKAICDNTSPSKQHRSKNHVPKSEESTTPELLDTKQC